MSTPKYPFKTNRQDSPWRRRLRYLYLRFVRLQGDPQAIARGIAIGVFVGITPTIPFHLLTAITMSMVLRGNKIAAALSTFVVSNPLTFIPQYYFSWKIGHLLTPSDISWSRISQELDYLMSGISFSESITSIGRLGFETIIGMVVGGCVLAAPFALLSFFAALRFFKTIDQKRQERRHKKTIPTNIGPKK